MNSLTKQGRWSWRNWAVASWSFLFRHGYPMQLLLHWFVEMKDNFGGADGFVEFSLESLKLYKTPLFFRNNYWLRISPLLTSPWFSPCWWPFRKQQQYVVGTAQTIYLLRRILPIVPLINQLTHTRKSREPKSSQKMVATLLPHTSISTDAFVELEALHFFPINLF